MITSTPTTCLSRAWSISILATIFSITTSFCTIETDVYICKGPQSKKYHYKKDCRGLSRCSTKTYKVTLTEAKKIGRTLCGWED